MPPHPVIPVNPNDGTAGPREIESTIYNPRRWFPVGIGTAFLLVAAIAFLVSPIAVRFGVPHRFPHLFGIVFAPLGGIAVAAGLRSMLHPVRIRHANPNVLQTVPNSPLVIEGATAYRQLTHELNKDGDGWRLEPSQKLWQNQKRFLIGFGLPFLAFFTAIIHWILQSEVQMPFTPSLLIALLVTGMCGGSFLVLIYYTFDCAFQNLPTLIAAGNRPDLVFHSAERFAIEPSDATSALKTYFPREKRRHQSAIPEENVRAVQLCGWKYVVGDSTIYAVQGLLVLQAADGGQINRLSLLLTQDYVGAARLMQTLAETLNVPFLYCADAEYWRLESTRAKCRPPLKSGGLI